jgi:hypothetical protein
LYQVRNGFPVHKVPSLERDEYHCQPYLEFPMRILKRFMGDIGRGKFIRVIICSASSG